MNLIVGGTGALGGAVARRLLARDEPVRVMTREPVRAEDLAAAGAEVVRGDLLDRGSLEAACRGARRVIAAAHSMLGRGRNASRHVDGAGHRTLIDVAAGAGVQRFVYTSVYDFGSDFQAIPFFRIKRETEEHLKTSGMAWTILRPTAFMEVHAHALIGEPIATQRRVVLFGQGERPRNFVAVDDVAQVAVTALLDPRMAGQTIDIGGPAHHSNSDVVRIYEQATDRRARVTRLPLALVRILATAVRPLHPGLSQVLRTGVIGDTVDQRYEGPDIQARFQFAPTPLEDWVADRVAMAGSVATPTKPD